MHAALQHTGAAPLGNTASCADSRLGGTAVTLLTFPAVSNTETNSCTHTHTQPGNKYTHKHAFRLVELLKLELLNYLPNELNFQPSNNHYYKFT